MALQRSVGNAAVGALLRSPPGSPSATRILQRGYDTDVRAAIQKKSYTPFGSDGDFEKAWGILNAPATGRMIAEMILDGHCHSLDAAPYALTRLPSAIT